MGNGRILTTCTSSIVVWLGHKMEELRFWDTRFQNFRTQQEDSLQDPSAVPGLCFEYHC
jgi:hypothetical protein